MRRRFAFIELQDAHHSSWSPSMVKSAVDLASEFVRARPVAWHVVKARQMCPLAIGATGVYWTSSFAMASESQ
jgi:hypothetical protein